MMTSGWNGGGMTLQCMQGEPFRLKTRPFAPGFLVLVQHFTDFRHDISLVRILSAKSDRFLEVEPEKAEFPGAGLGSGSHFKKPAQEGEARPLASGHIEKRPNGEAVLFGLVLIDE